MKVVGEYMVHSALVVEDMASFLYSIKILWLVALLFLVLMFWKNIKSALQFLKTMMESGGFSAERESYIEKRMMQYMFATIPENHELIRQLNA